MRLCIPLGGIAKVQEYPDIFRFRALPAGRLINLQSEPIAERVRPFPAFS
jgi:hypothetical protein